MTLLELGLKSAMLKTWIWLPLPKPVLLTGVSSTKTLPQGRVRDGSPGSYIGSAGIESSEERAGFSIEDLALAGIKPAIHDLNFVNPRRGVGRTGGAGRLDRRTGGTVGIGGVATTGRIDLSAAAIHRERVVAIAVVVEAKSGTANDATIVNVEIGVERRRARLNDDGVGLPWQRGKRCRLREPG